MMSKEKRRVPKLRFPGFTEDWEQRKLRNIVDFLDGQRKPLKESERTKGKYPYYGASGIIDYINDYLFDENLVLLSEDGANIIDRNYPVCFIATGKYWVNNHAHVLKVKTGVIDKFICESLERLDYTKFNTGTAQPKLNQDICQKIVITIPNEDEQKCISEFLDRINNIITLHQRKLDNLKLKKKALLQKFFPKNGERYPELRFPGFTDAWEQRKLLDISTKVTTKNVDVHYTETLTNSAEQGIISQVDFFDKEISNKDNINGYYIVDNNDFIYNPRISTLAPVGPINRNKLNRTGIMSPLYTVFRASKVDLGFLEWYFQSNHWHRYMKLNGDSGARADRIAIKDSTFFEMPIKIPVNIKEQVLIGETLEKFNQYITLHQRKLDHLKLQKKALLQQMFV